MARTLINSPACVLTGSKLHHGIKKVGTSSKKIGTRQKMFAFVSRISKCLKIHLRPKIEQRNQQPIRAANNLSSAHQNTVSGIKLLLGQQELPLPRKKRDCRFYSGIHFVDNQ